MNPSTLTSVQDDTPWVWFDVDDVLVSSTPLFQESLDRWSGQVIPWQTWTHNHFHLFYGVASDDRATIQKLRQTWEEDQVLERSPLFPDAQDALHALAEDGFKIGLLTARAWHSRGLEVTEAMVEHHHLPVSRVITLPWESTKADLLQASGTRVVGFLDDTIRHVEGCREAGFNAVLRDQPWNVTAHHLPRVADLSAFVQRVKLDVQAQEQAELEACLNDGAAKPQRVVRR